MTLTMQSQKAGLKTEDRFFWNKYLLKDLK